MKKRHPEHVNLERWLVSYADFITLLFAFFVVMYAMSQADINKLKKVSESIQKAFGAEVSTIDLQGQSGGATVNVFDAVDIPNPRIDQLPVGKMNTSQEPDPHLIDVKERLEESISMEVGMSSLGEKPELLFDSRGLVVRVGMKDMYDSGQVDVPQDIQPLLDRIGRIVTSTGHLIRIEGHCDASESDAAKKQGFSSTWELSTARATWLARYWIEKLRLDPKSISVGGYAHYHALSDGKTDVDKRSNRRVEVIILNSQYQIK